MHTIAVIYNTCNNFPAIDHNQRTLENIFEGHIRVKNYYFDQLTSGVTIEGDAFLVSNESLLSQLPPFIPDFKKVVLMKRNVQKAGIPAILEIPAGTDVLLVNDSFDSSVNTVYMLYELGISHLNLIPFDESLSANDETYLAINYALTPGEGWLVPQHIRHVVDFHYRVLSFGTLSKLADLLQLHSDIVSRNLIMHLNMLAESSGNIHTKFLDSHLKSQMLDLIVHNSPSAILATNDKFEPVYSNEPADILLHIDKFNTRDSGPLLSPDLLALLQSEEKTTVVEINGSRYMLTKSALSLMDQLMGYCFTFQDENYLHQMEMNLSHHAQKKGLIAKYHFQDIIYTSSIMEKAIIIAKRAAATDYTVLIQGESGTGKELLAQSIHNHSHRKDDPFVAINCNTLPESLLESQLFGYEGGSFTGAKKSGKPGLFEQANHGTIFLDEVGDISANLQSQLLRVLQERQIMRIGSDQVIDLDVRIIAATNQDLEKLVAEGKFRSDLFYRLNVIPIEVPPLRKRKEDILPLLTVFLGSLYQEVSEKERSEILRYSWPGNVRQLESTAKYYETLHDFPSYLHVSAPTASAAEFSYGCEMRTGLPQGGPLSNGHPSSELPNAQPASGQSSAPSCSQQVLEERILRIIEDSTEPFHGIGRSGILIRLREEQIHMSDGKLRQVLSQFEAERWITIARGRGGCRITHAGIDHLNDDPN